MEQHVQETLELALSRIVNLEFPGGKVNRFVLSTDWAKGFGGYTLVAKREKGENLVDIGSTKVGNNSSPYLGELSAIIWACKSTKGYCGDKPLLIKTDNMDVVLKSNKMPMLDDDARSVRQWGWLMENKLGFSIEFLPGSENGGPNLLSRPILDGPKTVMQATQEDMRDII